MVFTIVNTYLLMLVFLISLWPLEATLMFWFMELNWWNFYWTWGLQASSLSTLIPLAQNLTISTLLKLHISVAQIIIFGLWILHKMRYPKPCPTQIWHLCWTPKLFHPLSRSGQTSKGAHFILFSRDCLLRNMPTLQQQLLLLIHHLNTQRLLASACWSPWPLLALLQHGSPYLKGGMLIWLRESQDKWKNYRFLKYKFDGSDCNLWLRISY